MIASFFTHWIWPANGSGGIWGDVFGSFLWWVATAIVAYVFWPRVRRAVDHWLATHVRAHTADLHAKLDEAIALSRHIVKHHPNIPNDVPGLPADRQPLS
jgi:hypothetical protein